MTAIVRYLEGVRFEATARGHRIICDQPPSNGGADTGMAPPEFLLVSLATCGAFYAAEYLRTRSLPADGLKVEVTAEKDTAPARLARFRIEVFAPGLNARHQDGVARAVKSCLIHSTLLHSPVIETVIRTDRVEQPEPAGAVAERLR